MKEISIEKVISTILGDTAKLLSETDLVDAISHNSKELLECSGLVFLPSGTGYILGDEGTELFAGKGVKK